MIVLFVIIVPLILALLALAIDYSIITSALNQARLQARLIALASLEEFYDDDDDDPHATSLERKLQRALNVANDALRQNAVLAMTGRQPAFAIPRNMEEYKAGHGALLAPGRYFTSLVPVASRNQPGVNCATRFEKQILGVPHCNPCGGNSERGNLPCFNPIFDISAPDAVVTGFQVSGELYPGVTTFFARSLGYAQVGRIAVSATSSLMPRRIVALTDVSRSVVAETHSPKLIQTFSPNQSGNAEADLGDLNPSNDSRGAYFAFWQNPGEPPLMTVDPNGDGARYPSFLSVINEYRRCMEIGRRSDPKRWPTEECGARPDPLGFSLQWAFLRHALVHAPIDPAYSEEGERGSGRDRSNQLMHYYDDYQLVETLGRYDDADVRALMIEPALHAGCNPDVDSNCAIREQFAVDMHALSPECQGANSPECQGPQPLSTILSGLASLVDALGKRRVAGDELGLIFFEQTSQWTRNILPTNRFDYLTKIVGPPPSERATHWADYAAAATRRAALKIFPSREGATNILDALASGLQDLALRSQTQGTLPTRNELILISDGLSTCVSCSGPETGLPRECFDLNQSGGDAIDFEDYEIFLFCQCNDQARYGRGCTYLCQLENNEPATAIEGCTPNDPRGAFYRYSRDFYSFLGGRTCASSACESTYDGYRESMGRIKSLVAELSAPGTGINIPIHVIAVGADVGPNTLDIPKADGSGECMSDAEARAPGVRAPFVRPGCADDGHDADCGDAFLNMSRAQPFYQASSDLYSIARATGGEFLPLRPLAPHCRGISTSAERCRSNPQQPECLCYTNPADPQCCGPVGTQRDNDILCRSNEQQIDDFIDSIVTRQTSFAVVDTGDVARTPQIGM